MSLMSIIKQNVLYLLVIIFFRIFLLANHTHIASSVFLYIIVSLHYYWQSYNNSLFTRNGGHIGFYTQLRMPVEGT